MEKIYCENCGKVLYSDDMEGENAYAHTTEEDGEHYYCIECFYTLYEVLDIEFKC